MHARPCGAGRAGRGADPLRRDLLPGAGAAPRPPPSLPLEPAHRREEINSYLTYPEWSIVHAYEDLAGVMRQGSESDFAYFASIASYWSSLCNITRLASSRGTISLDYKVMLYTIGLSFAAEMGLKGLYELTIGRFTAWFRGPKRTPEDEFALAVAEDYAAFLRQTPWYEYPFGVQARAVLDRDADGLRQRRAQARAAHRPLARVRRQGRLRQADRPRRGGLSGAAHHPQRGDGARSTPTSPPTSASRSSPGSTTARA